MSNPNPYPWFVQVGNVLALLVVCLVVVLSVSSLVHNYQSIEQTRSVDARVLHDLDVVTRPDQFVITDAQFVVAQANRSTPPQLVDTSGVRVHSGYLSADQLISLATQPQVQAIFFYTDRLIAVPGFQQWVSLHFHRVYDYGNNQGIWVKN